MSNEKKKRVISAALAEEIRGDVEGDGFIRREHLGTADLFFLEYEYPALWTDWTSASLRSPAEIRAAKRLLAALDKCAAGAPAETPRAIAVGDWVLGPDVGGLVVDVVVGDEEYRRQVRVQGNGATLWQPTRQCVLLTPDAPTTVTPAWAAHLLDLATAQHDAAVACTIAEETYDKEYKEYEKVRVARNEARELVQQRSRELRAATTALALLKAAT